VAFPKNIEPPPQKLASLPIDILDLSVRSYNALKYRTKTVGELALLSDEKLLKIRNFGHKSLVDVHRALTEFMATHAGEIAAESDFEQLSRDQENSQSSNANVQALSPGGWRVPHEIGLRKDAEPQVGVQDVCSLPVEVLDLSTRSLKVLIRLHICSITELLEYPKEKLFRAENIGRKSLNEIESKLFAYLSNGSIVGRADHVANEAVESAGLGTRSFVQQMLSRLPDRQRNIIADRYGLWDGIAETLQDIGDKLGLTRERIRQIEEKGLKRLRRIYGHGTIKNLVLAKITTCLESQSETFRGIVGEDQFTNAFADDCSLEEAALAITLLNDINARLFHSQLIEAEPGVYCIDTHLAAKYKALLEIIQTSLRKHQKPFSEEELHRELIRRESPVTTDQEALLGRIFQVSPSVMRLRDGSIGLSEWTGFLRRDAISLAEATLRLLGRPAHFREITQKIGVFFPDAGPINERTIHNGLWQGSNKFVWVKNGTYGLSAWGITKPPYIKDRLIELLSDAQYPLPFWHLEEKVLEMCNCKKDSVRMTLDLNPKLFRKFEGDQYGLRQHYEK
jgi:hypothetical protein